MEAMVPYGPVDPRRYNFTATLPLEKQQIIHLYLSLKRVLSLATASVTAAMSHLKHFLGFLNTVTFMMNSSAVIAMLL